MHRNLNRRELIRIARALGAALALPVRGEAAPREARERRDLFPQGVASGDPDDHSVLLWTRAPGAGAGPKRLVVEVAEDQSFARLAAVGEVRVSAASDGTCRFLAAGLRPDRAYWYRFIDEEGHASRTGRTFTAPRPDAEATVRFAFASCQNLNLGHLVPYRRMIAEDEALAAAEQLRFVLHLGDFIYEMVWYPEDRPQGLQGRRVRDAVRLPRGEKIGDYHVPAGVDDYRALYRAYLEDPDLQDARARWPFICVWDNHEFSNRGWQSQASYDRPRPAQRLKVAANQAWFEYVPARVRQPGGVGLDRFVAPAVEDRPLEDFDAQGLSRETNNLKAVNSLLIARALRWGRHLELLLTDNRSFRSEPVLEGAAGAAFRKTDVPFFAAQDVVEALGGSRSFAGGDFPATIRFGGKDVPNPRAGAEPATMLGADQKAWFLDRLRRSGATWTLWGNSVGMLDLRADPQNLPPEHAARWPTSGYGIMGAHDWSAYPAERAEILDAAGKSGSRLVSLVGDRHAFYAGLLSPSLPPSSYSPVAAEFVVGSVSTPTVVEAAAHALPAGDPLSALILVGTEQGPVPTLNLTLRHGVRTSLAFARTGSLDEALSERNPDVAPHLLFADAAGHGFATVEVRGDRMDVEFVAMPPPLSPTDDDILYRATHRLERWARGERPRLTRLRAGGAALGERFLEAGAQS